MSEPSVPLTRPVIGDPEIAAVVAVLQSGWLTTGAQVRAFEERFAAYIGAPHAVAVNSGTAALHLSLLAAEIGPDDEVVTTPLTFCATANSIIHTGARPVFADVDRTTGNLTPADVEAALTPRTRAILPVDLGGRPTDLTAFRDLADTHGLTLIEDAAHCLEGISDGRKVGTIADLTCFSFYATKNLTTGEGGMITTASETRASWARVAAQHGLSRNTWARHAETGGRYDVVMAGFKYNMTDLQAAIGLPQLERIPARHARRADIWRRYQEGLSHLPVTLPPPVGPRSTHAHHVYPILVDPDACGWTRDALQRALHDRGIGTSIHFTPLHLFRFYAERFGLTRGMFPHAEFIGDRTLSLPLSAVMSNDEADRVVGTLRTVLERSP